MNLILSMMIMTPLIFLYLNHPLSMGLILITQTLMSAFMVGFMMNSFFFSYIIIIIMLSGALVLFIYMASVASNEKFQFSYKMMILPVIFSFIYMALTMMNTTNCHMNNLIVNESISLIKIFNMNTAQLTIMMIMYLLITMIVVSKMVKVNEGPLRVSK
uniref:NADH-ubiquinone oxidoreductase chain 6 n=1 Tax=Catacanthus incarnatus TaxID=696896 RepID=A0A4D6X0C4_CATIN|nr:NADH dehydrogenase subunit 6 [Catacanthus incarnatus]QCI09297.1 NADH dehydrogenase subunit 6 [Catacanthus incarnatus]